MRPRASNLVNACLLEILLVCGICGKIAREPWEHGLIGAMTQALRHRGPDDEGLYFDRTGDWHIGLGHRRLSIIDLSERGRQPMVNEDGRIVLVANGEIYNYKNLVERLKSLGHRFRSASDSEVIIHAYEEWGFDCLTEISGMFAFAVWDRNEELLFMAKDPFGEKPLFYAVNEDRLSFASELPALIQDSSISRQLDPESVLQYLYYQVVFSPRTISKDIRKLPPGHYATFKQGKLCLKDYTKPIFNPGHEVELDSIEECSERVQDVLSRIIAPLMMSDVPVGLCLSGGLDSSLILAFMAEKAHRPIHTFSIGFEQEGFCELNWASRMAHYFGTIHHEDIIQYDFLDILPKLIHHLGEPMADASIIPYYYLSKLAASEVKVVLGGDGADEMWGGYRRHMLRPYLPMFSLLPFVIKNVASLFPAGDGYYSHSLIESLALIQELSLAQGSGYVPWNPLFNLETIHSLVNGQLMDKIGAVHVDFSRPLKGMTLNDSVNRMLLIDQMTFLPEDILTKVDRMSMAHSLEVRSPFLHPEMASLAARIPGRLKVRRGAGKRVLKMAARDHLPPRVIGRRKHGFNVPVDAWFRGEGHAFIRDTLLAGSLVKDGWIKKACLRGLIAAHHRRQANHGRKLWGLMILQMWQDQLGSGWK